jgi:hypothetical protein
MFEKSCVIECNGVSASFTTYCCSWADPENPPTYLDIRVNNKSVGISILDAINLSRDLSESKYDKLFTRELMKERYDDYIRTMCSKSGYKSKNSGFKNMMHVSIYLEDVKNLRILPTIHEGLTGWDFLSNESNIFILYESPPEIIGAAVRYAFSRCKGKGPYTNGAEIVTKALFPDGVPSSLEEYLESIDKDYKKWLISC